MLATIVDTVDKGNVADGSPAPRKRGRPPRAGVAATEDLRVWMTKSERTGLDKRAASCALSVSDYVRKLIAADIAASAETP